MWLREKFTVRTALAGSTLLCAGVAVFLALGSPAHQRATSDLDALRTNGESRELVVMSVSSSGASSMSESGVVRALSTRIVDGDGLVDGHTAYLDAAPSDPRAMRCCASQCMGPARSKMVRLQGE